MATVERPRPESDGRRGSRIDAEEARHIQLSPVRAVFRGAPGTLGGGGGAGSPQAGALHDDLTGAMGEAIEGAVGEDGVVEEGHPLLYRAVARDHGGGTLIPFDQDVVEVARLLGGEFLSAHLAFSSECLLGQAVL